MIYARSSLIEASESAKALLANPAWSEEFRKAFMQQMLVAYARPFNQSQVKPKPSKRVAALDASVVPKAFELDHKQAIVMRDQAIGHKDAIAFEDTALNRVIVVVDSRGFEFRTTAPFDMLPDGLRRFVQLCETLIEHCEVSIERHASHFVGLGTGAYFLNLEEAPKEWLQRQPDK